MKTGFAGHFAVWWCLVIAVGGAPCLAEKPRAVDQKVNTAVLTLKNLEGVTAGEAEIISDRLRAELFRTGKVNIMEREQMKEVLSEQDFMQSEICTDEECMVEIGRMLGVEQIVTGSIGKLQSIYLLNLRVVDVQTGKVTRVVSEDLNGMEVVVSHLSQISRRLTGQDPGIKESERYEETGTPKQDTDIAQRLIESDAELVGTSRKKPADQSRVEAHEGFFLRIHAGGSWGSIKLDDDFDEFLMKGGGTSFRFLIGGHVADNFALFGQLGGTGIMNPTMEYEGVGLKTEDVSTSVGGFGAGGCYYFMPTNIHLTGAIDISSASFSYTFEGEEEVSGSKYGPAIYLSAGKEWFVGSGKWGLGFAVFGHAGTRKDKGSDPATITNVATGIACTATLD